jgi:anti-anti-sigma factor
MSFKLETYEQAQVVKVSDSIFFDAVQDFDSAVQQAEEASAKNVIIDLSGVEMICSSAITTIVKHHMSMQKRGGKLVIAGCNESVMKIMQLLGLNKLMAFADDVPAAASL